jgi:hypothetical protein
LGLRPLPATSNTVALFIAAETKQALAPSTLFRRLAAILKGLRDRALRAPVKRDPCGPSSCRSCTVQATFASQAERIIAPREKLTPNILACSAWSNHGRYTIAL